MKNPCTGALLETVGANLSLMGTVFTILMSSILHGFQSRVLYLAWVDTNYHHSAIEPTLTRPLSLVHENLKQNH